MSHLNFPVFIIGMPRSGTTLVSNLINASEEIYIPEETHFFQLKSQWNKKSFDTFKNDFLDLDKNTYLKGLDITNKDKNIINKSSSYKEIFESICKLKAKKKGIDRWGEKTPIHFEYIDEINEYFPRAKFVNIIRDPRDVINSILASGWGNDQIYRRLSMYKQNIKKYNVEQKNILNIKYEELVKNPENTVKSIYKFLGLHFNNEILNTFYLTSNQNFSLKNEPWKKNNLNPINDDNAFKWKRTKSNKEIQRNKFISWYLKKELNSISYEKFNYPSFLYRNVYLLAIWTRYVIIIAFKYLKN